jgi:RimJ/RimL family protein N-acetyltransferase
MTADEALAWFAEIAERSSSTFWLLETGGELAGSVSLYARSLRDHSTRFAIGMFAPRFVGRGLDTEATRLAFTHAFTALQLHRAASSKKDASAIAGWLEGCWYDDIVMGVLEHESRS